MSVKIRATWDNLRTLAFGSISGTYALVGTAIGFPISNISINNNTDVLLTFSTDGVNDKFIVSSLTSRIWDIASNRSATGDQLMLPQGTTIYVKGSPTLGSVYLEVIYAS